MTTLITVISLWLGAAAAVLTPIVYAVGNQWSTHYWGRTLLLKDAVIALAYMRSAGALIGHRLPHTVTWDTWAISAGMAIALIANLVVMVVVTKRGQRRAALESTEGAP